MTTFPLLSSGAFAQYPVSQLISYETEAIEFVDGQSQRCLVRGKRLRKWLLRLELISQEELATLEDFFRTHQGTYRPFTFLDPFTGETVFPCRFGADLSTSTEVSGWGKTAIWVEETYA
jgi:hypothetical protein